MTGTYAFPRNVFLGFDHIFNELDSISKHATDSYPPHNVVKEDELEYVLELAVAGFGEGDISIELKDHILTIEGSREKRREQEKYIHKGISARKFKKSFRLSEYTEVVGAELKDGILAIGLEVVLPEEKRPQMITINSHKGKTNDSTSTKGLFTRS
ncbi:Hsp20 family protein [bacterium]|jgi:molecular chaperone IbpA|nr:Hsp20 family protein [bacterium]